MIQKTFEIIRGRWPEVMLLVVSQAAVMMLFEHMLVHWGLTGEGDVLPGPDWAMFLMGMAVAGVVIVWHLLLLGFLKTAAVECAAPKEPLTLLRAGRPYLWRILLVQFLLAMLLWLFTGIIIYIYFGAKGQAAAAQPSGWLIESAGAAATVILFKPVFLIPAFIVALDLRITESLFHMLRVSVVQAGVLFKAVLAGYAVTTAVGVLLSFAPAEGAFMYAASGTNYLAKSLNLLILMTAAVVWATATFSPPEPPAEATE